MGTAGDAADAQPATISEQPCDGAALPETRPAPASKATQEQEDTGAFQAAHNAVHCMRRLFACSCSCDLLERGPTLAIPMSSFMPSAEVNGWPSQECTRVFHHETGSCMHHGQTMTAAGGVVHVLDGCKPWLGLGGQRQSWQGWWPSLGSLMWP